MILNMPGKRPENLKELLRYINLLEEQLRFILANIDGSDISPGTIGSDQLADGVVTATHIAAESITVEKISPGTGNALDISSNKAITLAAKKLEEAGEAIAQIVIETDKISSKVADAEGNISTLQQTANGLESRVADTEGNVSTLQQTAQGLEIRAESTEETLEGLGTRVTEAEASLTVQAGEIRLKASKTEVKDAVDDIQIGGRNLLKDSEKNWVCTAPNVAVSVPVREILSPHIGKEICVGFDIISNSGNPVKVYAYQNSGISIGVGMGAPLSFTPGTIDYTRFSFATTAKDWGDQDGMSTGVIIFYDPSGLGFTVRRIKIELGNKPTDWTAAPEDLETRVTEAEAELLVQSGAIAAKAEKSTVDSLAGRVTEAEAELAVQAGEIALKVSQAEYDSLSVGGTNILPGYAGGKTTNRYLGIPVREVLSSHVGKEICVSFECKASAARRIRVYPYQNSGISIKNDFYFTPSTTEFTRHSFVTTAHDWGQIDGYSTGELSFYDTVSAQSYTIRRVKIELGNKPTDWSPSPDDPVSTLKNTAMTLNASGIEMNTTGYFRLYANDGNNSRIKLGGDNSSANFSVDETGRLGAVSGAFSQDLTVGGNGVWTKANIIISQTQPTGVHDVLWIQPLQGVEQVKHSFLNTSQGYWVHSVSYNYTMAPQSADVLSAGGSYTYSLTLQMAKGGSGKGIKSYTMKAVLSTSAGSVTLTSPAFTLNDWGNAQVTLTGTGAVNLLASSGNVNAAISVEAPETGNTYLYMKNNTEITLTSKNTAASSAGAQTCTIHYIP